MTHTHLVWPLHEPVYCAAINDGWEHTQARSEGFAQRRHAQDNVDVGLDAVDVLWMFADFERKEADEKCRDVVAIMAHS